MSLLGIDIGTTGCKAAVYSLEGVELASAYEEYDIQRPRPGWAELDAVDTWQRVKRVIAEAASQARADPVRALSISSLGEATVPVTAERQILGPSLLNFDARGEEYLPALAARMEGERLYRLNGNALGNHYSLTKLLWLKEHQPEIYDKADKFLHWGSLVAYLLGADPCVDYSLANRTLLFDISRGTWADELLSWAGIASSQLPRPVPSGTIIGTVASHVAAELGLPKGVAIVAGAHDQCANAIGAGVIAEGRAMYGMGTYLCIVATFSSPRDPATMMARGLNTEHHAAPGLYVSFLYNHGGSMLKWYRDTFAATERRVAQAEGRGIYPELLAEMPREPSGLLALPHFAATGPPQFISDSSGVLAGLRLETSRGQVLKGLLEGATFYLRACVEDLPATGIAIQDFTAVGGGSKSDVWLQLSADILGRPITRARITEAGTLGAAILAGTGSGLFPSMAKGVEAMVHLGRTFTPDPSQGAAYERWFARYQCLWPALEGLLRELASDR